MTEEIPDRRPNCGRILLEKHLWALDLNEFEIENDLKVILQGTSGKAESPIFMKLC
jgi:hypothetical protein